MRLFPISRLFLIFGMVFLYLPLVYLLIFSFSESSIAGIWSNFSFKWFKILFSNEDIINALITSVNIATIVASFSVLIGTLAAIAIIRIKKFKGKTVLKGMISAPLVMPEVITGISMLLLFVSLEKTIGWPKERGFATIAIAHITLTIAYVYLIIQARLIDFDNNLEEAAQDLGARPYSVFLKITLPIIYPSLVSAWLLAFAISLDDVVIASFVTGPGSTTLPILIFSSIRLGMSPEINALASIILLVVSTGIVIAGLLIKKKEI